MTCSRTRDSPSDRRAIARRASGEVELALSLLRTGAQARTREFRVFYYVEALEVLSGLVPGGGAVAVKIRRLLKHVGIKPARTSMDPRKDHADVLAELRDVVGGLPVDRPDHAQPLRLERDGYGNSRALGEWPLFAVTGP